MLVLTEQSDDEDRDEDGDEVGDDDRGEAQPQRTRAGQLAHAAGSWLARVGGWVCRTLRWGARRRRLEIIRQRGEAAALIIQRVYRGWAGRRRVMRSECELARRRVRNCVVVVQSSLRRMRARRLAKELRRSRASALFIISRFQAAIRRRRLRKRDAAARLLQRAMRRRRARQLVAALRQRRATLLFLADRTWAALAIQRRVRARALMKQRDGDQ